MVRSYTSRVTRTFTVVRMLVVAIIVLTLALIAYAVGTGSISADSTYTVVTVNGRDAIVDGPYGRIGVVNSFPELQEGDVVRIRSGYAGAPDYIISIEP